MDFEEPLPQTSDFEKDRLLDVAEYDTLRTRLAAVENHARQLRAGLAIRRAMESCASNRMSEKRSFHNDAGFPLRCRVETEHLHDERIHFKPAARAPVELRIEAQRLFPTNVYGKRSVLRIPLDLRLVTLWNLGTNAGLDEERKRPAGLTSPLNCSSVPIPGQLAYLLCGRPETLTPALLLRFIVSTRVHVTDEQTEAQLIIAADTREKHLCQINIVKEARHGLYTIHIYCEKAAFRQRLLTDLQALILVTAFGFTHGPSAALRAAPDADVLTERFDYLIQEFST
ncbi:unnamed protein product, partial [Mesorhabditis spiculigera]